jgi:NAD+ synthase
MPINSNSNNTELSKKQLLYLKQYNVESEEIDLSLIYNSYNKLMSSNYPSDLGFANTKARLRMITLYQIAASKGGIVVGTGNKVEDFGVGFFTKYGDGGVDISPIADLYKTEVRNLGRHLGVIDEIIKAEPTDGLWEDNRVDEVQIGATYEELEWAMEKGIGKQNYSEKEYKIIETFLNFNKKNKHKMVSIPIFDLKENEII